jgi:hypothetical protein
LHEVYTAGTGDATYSQLGLVYVGTSISLIPSTWINTASGYAAGNVSFITGGLGFNQVLMKNGTLFSWGNNNYGTATLSQLTSVGQLGNNGGNFSNNE